MRAARQIAGMTLAAWGALERTVPGELVDGVLVEEEMPTNVHELVAAWWFARLYAWVDAHGGVAFGSEHKLAVAPRRGRKPDVTVYESVDDLEPHASVSHTTPLAVVEVVTPTPRDTRRDRIDKREEYARARIRFYFLVDPAVRTVEVFELGDDGRYVAAAARTGGRLRLKGLRGLSLDLDDLMARIDKLERLARKR